MIDESCVCWSDQYFGTRCDYICRDDLCNGMGICGNESFPRVVDSVFQGRCVCDDPLDTSIHCGPEHIIDTNNSTGNSTDNTTFISHQEALPAVDIGLTGDSAFDAMIIITLSLICCIGLFCVFLKRKVAAGVHSLDNGDDMDICGMRECENIIGVEPHRCSRCDLYVCDHCWHHSMGGTCMCCLENEHVNMVDRGTSTRPLPIANMEMIDLSSELDRAEDISLRIINRSPELSTP